MNVYKAIRALQLEGVTSQRKAAKLLGISRNTVKKYWNGDTVPWNRKPYKRQSTVITGEIEEFIKQCFELDKQENEKKQVHTARRIYTRLKDEAGYTGSESSIRAAVRRYKLECEANDVFIPLSFSPGEAVQIDWGEAKIYLSGEKITVHLFCARLCYSCTPFVIAYRRENLESFLDAIIQTLNFFGGIPRNLIFDNARIAVKSGFGAHARTQDDYAQLASHYGFEPVFCNPRSGHEKGLVENLVGYIRRNVCVPLPRVDTLEELNAKLLEHCINYRQHKITGRTQTVGVMFEEEKAHLHPLPKYVIDVSKKVYPRVSRHSTICFETNLYSVPCKYRGKSTTVKAYPNTVEIWIEGEQVAVHRRCLGKDQEALDLKHYLPILERKGRAIQYARPVRDAVPSEFLHWLQRQHLTSKEVVALLEQCLSDGYQAVMRREQPTSPPGSTTCDGPHQPVDLSEYDKLYAQVKVAAS